MVKHYISKKCNVPTTLTRDSCIRRSLHKPFFIQSTIFSSSPLLSSSLSRHSRFLSNFLKVLQSSIRSTRFKILYLLECISGEDFSVSRSSYFRADVHETIAPLCVCARARACGVGGICLKKAY